MSGEAMVFNTDGDPIHGMNGSTDLADQLTIVSSGLTGGFSEARRVEYIIPAAERKAGVAHYYIEASCNEMFGQAGPDGERYYPLSSADLVVLNQEAWRLMYDFDAIHQVYNTLPDDSPLAMRAMWVANEIMNVFQEGKLESIAPCRKVAETILGEDWEKQIASESTKAEKQKGSLWGVGHWYVCAARWPKHFLTFAAILTRHGSGRSR